MESGVDLAMIYMDHAATTALHPEAAKAMEPYQKERYGNPSGAYELAGQAKEAVERARLYAAKLIGARAEEICFTSGGTESDNWALRVWQKPCHRREDTLLLPTLSILPYCRPAGIWKRRVIASPI